MSRLAQAERAHRAAFMRLRQLARRLRRRGGDLAMLDAAELDDTLDDLGADDLDDEVAS